MLSCFRHVPLSVTLWTVAHQALSIGLLRQEYWSGLPFPSPGDLPHPGIKPGFPASQADPLPPSHQGNPQCFLVLINLASGRLPPSSNFPSYTLSFWYTQVSDFFFHIFYLFFLLDSTQKWDQIVFIFLSSFTYIIPSRSIHIMSSGRIASVL